MGRLLSQGYDIVVESGHLIIRRLPYRAADGLRTDGRLVLPINDVNGVLVDQATPEHVIWFAGAEPLGDDGTPLGTASPHSFGSETANCMMSFKPISGRYDSIVDKVNNYARLLLRAAEVIDPEVTATPGAAYQVVEDDLPFVYRDTNTTRAGLGALTQVFRDQTVAIVGVGGTGSYILDQLAKTPVKRILLVDGDTLENHNAFRAPGAASLEDLQSAPNTAEYFASQYSRMHTGIEAVPHALTVETMHVLDTATFVFLAAADAPQRPEIMLALRDRDIPFIDVGMHVIEGNGGLTGTTYVNTYLPNDDRSVPARPPAAPEADDYASNIQIADLNALNALLAVIQWKRHLAFYATHQPCDEVVYKLFANEIRNGCASE